MSDVNLVEVFVDPTGPEIIEVMSPGPPGVQGPAGSGGLSPIAPNTLLGNNTGSAAIPSGLTDTQIKTLLGLATTDSPSFAGLQLFDTTNADYGNVYLEDNYYDFRNFENDLASIRANTIEAQEVFIAGLQSFTGTSTPGLQLKSLTTAQINTLASASALPVGSILVDSTTDRIDARLARGTVELIDSAGGQVIAGNLAATTLMVGDSTGPLLRNNAGTIEARNNANSSGAPFGCSNLTASGTLTLSGAGTTQIVAQGIRRRDGMSNFLIHGSGATATGTYTSITLSPLADGVWTQASGTLSAVSITPSYNQVASTASNTDFLINRTETSVGSGAQNFVDFQVGGSSRFRVSNAGAVVIGSGTLVTSILSATATLDFGSIAANSFANLTITVTGAALGDTVSIGVPNGSLLNDISFFGWVSATNTVTIRCSNVSNTTARDPASGTFRATVTKF